MFNEVEEEEQEEEEEEEEEDDNNNNGLFTAFLPSSYTSGDTCKSIKNEL